MFCPWCGTKNPEDAVYCEACGRHLRMGIHQSAQPAFLPTTVPVKRRGLSWWLWAIVGFVFVGVVVLGIIVALPKADQITMVSHMEITQPDEVSKEYLTSGDLRSYTRGQAHADVAVMEAISLATLEEWLQQMRVSLDIQGFKQVDDRDGLEVYRRTWDPVLCRDTEEYVEILVVGPRIVMARGTSLDLVDQVVREAAK